MISVAAELAGMHPQTLRQYDRIGLVQPSRAPEARRYSQRDVNRLQQIQRSQRVSPWKVFAALLSWIPRGAATEQIAALQRQVEDAKVKLGMAERVAAGTSGDVILPRGTRPAPRRRSSAVVLTVSRVNLLGWDKRSAVLAHLRYQPI